MLLYLYKCFFTNIYVKKHLDLFCSQSSIKSWLCKFYQVYTADEFTLQVQNICTISSKNTVWSLSKQFIMNTIIYLLLNIDIKSIMNTIMSGMYVVYWTVAWPLEVSPWILSKAALKNTNTDQCIEDIQVFSINNKIYFHTMVWKQIRHKWQQPQVKYDNFHTMRWK